MISLVHCFASHSLMMMCNQQGMFYVLYLIAHILYSFCLRVAACVCVLQC